MLFKEGEVAKEYYRTGKWGSFLQVETEDGEFYQYDSVENDINISAIIQSYGGYKEMPEENPFKTVDEPLEGNMTDEEVRGYVGE